MRREDLALSFVSVPKDFVSSSYKKYETLRFQIVRERLALRL
jgi:hypothetical protein